MSYQISSFRVSPVIIGGALVAGFLLSVPVFASAASFAYVNRSGEVSMVTATTPEDAIRTAPLIAEHSGVMLLQSQTDQELIGDTVTGI